MCMSLHGHAAGDSVGLFVVKTTLRKDLNAPRIEYKANLSPSLKYWLAERSPSPLADECQTDQAPPTLHAGVADGHQAPPLAMADILEFSVVAACRHVWNDGGPLLAREPVE